MTIKMKKTDETADLHPLFCQYHGQHNTQPAYIEIDLDNEIVMADYSGETGNGIPMDVWYGHARQYRVSTELTASEINDLMGEILPLAKKLHSLYEKYYDGSNFRCRFTDEFAADEIETQISKICSDAVTTSYGVRYASDYYNEWNVPEPEITADMTDEQVAAIAATETQECKDFDCTLLNAFEYFIQKRNEAQAEIESAQ